MVSPRPVGKGAAHLRAARGVGMLPRILGEARVEQTWGTAPVEPLDRLVHLSHLVGQDETLVQPGGGNSSVKLRQENPFGESETVLVVKGSGTDLRTIRPAGFTRLSLARLDTLRRHAAMSDEEMMSFMAACMLHPDRDPVPSVETPLHSVLPAPVILHTHDVVTMSLTNLAEADGRRRVEEVFGGEVVYLPYVRPGFPLARAVIDGAAAIPPRARGLALAHHGLVLWGDDAEEVYERLRGYLARAREVLAARRAGRRAVGVSDVPAASDAELTRRARLILPIARGEIGGATGVIVAWDGGQELRQRLEAPDLEPVTRRGMATPEHILRAGAWPLWLRLDFSRPDAQVEAEARTQLRAERERYEAYHARHAAAGQEPLEDWAKVALVPGLGLLAAFRDRASAETAATCYRAGLTSLENAERLGGFEFIPEPDVFEFEHWPLERRKVEEAVRREKQSLLMARHVALIVGGGSGIGAAAALRFAAEGAHVVVADLDAASATAVAARWRSAFRDAPSAWPRTRATTPASKRPSRPRSCASAGSTICSTPPAWRRASPRSPISGAPISTPCSRFTTPARSSPCGRPRR